MRTLLRVLLILALAAPAAAQNLLVNSTFDTDLSGWENEDPFVPQAWSPRDVTGSSSSGSAQITTSVGGRGSSDGIRQCVQVTPATSYVARIRAFVETQSEPGNAFLNVDYYSGDDCDDATYLSGILKTSSDEPRDTWAILKTSGLSPSNAHSAAFRITAQKQDGATPGNPFTIFADGARFTVEVVEDGSCVPGSTALCLNEGGRFQAEVSWRSETGATGSGQAVDIGKRDSGLFYFFDAENIEMLVKVLDACNLPGFDSYWVFYAATTNVEFTLTVTDTLTEQVRQYHNALGHAAAPVQDTDAFRTCP